MKTKLTWLSVVAGISLLIAGCCAPHQSTKWEYQQLHSAQTDAALNKLADEGWVLAFSGINSAGEPWYVLKRAKK